MAESRTYIWQLGSTPEGVFRDTQKPFYISDYCRGTQDDYGIAATCGVNGIWPAQSPMCRANGLHTDGAMLFSDSPELAPELFSHLRYAHGRGTSQYGSLYDDHGQLITQMRYDRSGVCSAQKVTSSNNGPCIQTSFSRSCVVNDVQGLVATSYDDVTQFEFLLEARPVPYSIKNPVDSDVYARLANFTSFPISSGTITLRLNDAVKIPLSISQFAGGNGGFDVTWINDKTFDYGSRVDVRWEFYNTDSPPERTIIDYWFTTVEDLTGPRIRNQIPGDNTTDIPISAYISFDVVDYETGVSTSSIELYVNNVLIDSSLFSVTSITDGCRVVYIPETPFLYGDSIPVVVFVSDLSEVANQSFFSWSFTTEGSIPPVLLNMSPEPCQSGVVRIRNISFEVIDAGHGLDKNSIVMGIDNTDMSDLYIVPIIHRFS